MTDPYNTGGFTSNGNGIFGDPNYGSFSASDYYTWDWKQIEAAIDGGSTITGDGEQTAQSVSYPKTLWDAGDVFEYVREVLNMVATSLADQANALAGGTSPLWKGDAADAFLATMTTFSKQVAANADVLSGGSAGLDPVPAQLVGNGNSLAKAQTIVHSIDAWYAQQALNMGVQPMSNGLVPVSQVSQIPPMMTHDMLNYALLPLVANYQMTIDSIVSPTAVTPKVGNSTGSPNPSPTDNVPNPSLDLSGLQNGLNNLLSGDSAGNNPGAGSPAPFPGGVSSTGAGVPGGAGGLPGGVTGFPGAGGLPGGVTGFPGTGGIPGGVAGFPGGAGGLPGGAGGLPGGAGGLPGGAGAIAGFPGVGGLPGGASAGAGGEGGVSPYSPKKLGTGEPGSALSALGSPEELGSGGLPAVGGAGVGEGGLPMMPMSPGMGAGMGGAQGQDRPDASGLLGGESKPWEEDGLGTGEALSADGAPVGGTGLAGLDPLAEGEGLPFMGSPGAGAAAGSQVQERPDASGLLGGEAEPWQEAGEQTEAGSPEGTEEGGLGLFGESAEAAGSVAVWPPVPPPSGDEKRARATRPAETTRTRSEPAPPEHAAEHAVTAEYPTTERVAVVSPSEAPDDTSAWEVAAGTSAAWLPAAVMAARGQAGDEHQTRYATEQSAWVDSGAGSEPGAPPPEPPLATWKRAAVTASSAGTGQAAPRCSADDVEIEEEPPSPEPDDDEEQDESAGGTAVAGLLVEETNRWGAWPGDSGVIE